MCHFVACAHAWNRTFTPVGHSESSSNTRDLPACGQLWYGSPHSLLLSYARAAAQRGELDAEGASKRAHAANIYADKKNQRHNSIINERSLDINYRSFIVESFGAFASDTWKFINTVCDPNTHPKANDEYNPWNNPDPSRAFVLATGFANQRGNAVMLLQANSRRRFQRASRRHASG